MRTRSARRTTCLRAAGRLPSFLIVGVPKAGTTALASYLAAHPDVFVSAEKELHFFDRAARDEAWYRRQFAKAGDAKAAGEATPTYILNERALTRMHRLVPDAKLIVLMRHPVDRAYSLYWWSRAVRERRDFATAVREEMAEGPSSAPAASGYLSYTGGGRYLELLQRACRFYDREQIVPIVSEHMRAQPDRVYADVCRFLGVDDGFVPPNLGAAVNPAYRVRSQRLRVAMFKYRAWKRLPFGLAEALDRLNRAPFDYPPMDPILRRELLDWFRPANDALASWLGRDLSVWST